MREQEKAPLGIEDEEWQSWPANARAVVRALCGEIEKLSAQVEKLSTRVTELEARLAQNSQNSSLSPSADPPGAPKYPPRKPSGGKRGGQYGHPGHRIVFLPVEEVDQIVECVPRECTNCHSSIPEGLADLTTPEWRQCFELPELKLKVTEYRLHTVNCPSCGKTVRGDVDPAMTTSAYGPRLSALLTLLHGQGMSLANSSQLVELLFRIQIPKSSVANICWRMNQALETAHAEACEAIIKAKVVYSDETGWSEEGKARWLWTHVSDQLNVYHVVASRSKKTLSSLLGESFAGKLISDRFASYNLIPVERRQICLAHLKRNLLGLRQEKGEVRIWSSKMLRVLRRVFILWHKLREGLIGREIFKEGIRPLREKIKTLLCEGELLKQKKGRLMALRLRKLELALWLFAAEEGIEPTNNISERALRRAVIFRKLSYGTQSSWGSCFVERMLTVTESLKKQNRDVFAFLIDTIQAYWRGDSAPNLLISS